MSKFSRLIQASLSHPAPMLEGDSVWIYGAGNKGREVMRVLARRGYVIAGFLDTHAKPGQRVDNIPVLTLNDVNHAPPNHSVVIAIHNYKAEIPALQNAIQKKGFQRTLNVVELYNALPGVFPDHYWLTDRTAYRAFGAALDRLDSLLADEASHHWLEAVLRFRLSGDYAALPEPHLGDQYRPQDLPAWPNPLRFIDCGAFDGDTLEHLAGAGYAFAAIAAFEPDAENFCRLAQASGQYGNAVCFPCALGSKTELLRFSADADMSSHLSSTGTRHVQCVTLDEVLPAFAPNLIKMDIEGAELEALRGARRMIARHRPGLAISLYHTPGHLWQIPLLLQDWDLGYRFYLRGHARNSCELVLYALPAESAT
ncbi:MAG: FkbM family methyltransferase [Zoogloeaceae bacterium]|jgi:FkbM family methyltransferase|nr:FkbM family methyltransferase [Zoogloeaceae bacterium]